MSIRDVILVGFDRSFVGSNYQKAAEIQVIRVELCYVILGLIVLSSLYGNSVIALLSNGISRQPPIAACTNLATNIITQ